MLFKDKYSDKILQDDSGCHVWLGAKCKDGYGQVKFLGRTVKAHRLSFFMSYGINTDMFKTVHRHGEDSILYYVCHTCDNPSCVNPDHLWLGTNRDNQLDSVKKGRRKTRNQSGPNNGNSKLTYEDLIDVFKWYDQGMKVVDIAKIKGVSNKTIYYNLNKRN